MFLFHLNQGNELNVQPIQIILIDLTETVNSVEEKSSVFISFVEKSGLRPRPGMVIDCDQDFQRDLLPVAGDTPAIRVRSRLGAISRNSQLATEIIYIFLLFISNSFRLFEKLFKKNEPKWGLGGII